MGTVPTLYGTFYGLTFVFAIFWSSHPFEPVLRNYFWGLEPRFMSLNTIFYI